MRQILPSIVVFSISICLGPTVAFAVIDREAIEVGVSTKREGLSEDQSDEYKVFIGAMGDSRTIRLQENLLQAERMPRYSEGDKPPARLAGWVNRNQ